MINVVLIDDERPALRELEFLLKDYLDISVIGIFTNPFEAIEQIEELQPQVVFLDINMPQLQGIDVASKIMDLSPKTDIVFVTAFDNYAVQAFEIHALDYILKPIDTERLKKTVQRLLENKNVRLNGDAHKLKIKCLGRLEVAWENQEPIKWRAEKTKEVFACLLHNQGRDISKEELLDMLWPEEKPEKAIRQLYNGIYYIRKALEEYGVDRELISIGNSYNLKIGSVNHDVRRFYELQKFNNSDNLEKLAEMESIYTGDYLESEDYSWAYFERVSLAKLYQRCLLMLARKYIDNKQFDKAERKLEKAYQRNPYEETITELLLNLYSITGENSKAVRHYKLYSNLIKEELGIGPNEKLYKLYKSIT